MNVDFLNIKLPLPLKQDLEALPRPEASMILCMASMEIICLQVSMISEGLAKGMVINLTDLFKAAMFKQEIGDFYRNRSPEESPIFVYEDCPGGKEKIERIYKLLGAVISVMKEQIYEHTRNSS